MLSYRHIRPYVYWPYFGRNLTVLSGIFFRMYTQNVYAMVCPESRSFWVPTPFCPYMLCQVLLGPISYFKWGFPTDFYPEFQTVTLRTYIIVWVFTIRTSGAVILGFHKKNVAYIRTHMTTPFSYSPKPRCTGLYPRITTPTVVRPYVMDCDT